MKASLYNRIKAEVSDIDSSFSFGLNCIKIWLKNWLDKQPFLATNFQSVKENLWSLTCPLKNRLKSVFKSGAHVYLSEDMPSESGIFTLSLAICRVIHALS